MPTVIGNLNFHVYQAESVAVWHGSENRNTLTDC